MIGPLLDCHAHVLPDAVVDRFPGGDSPRFVTAERRVLGRMLEAQAEAGVTHAIVSDSFYLETAAEELPDWSPADRAKVYNDGLADLVAQHPGRLWGLGCLDPWAGEAAARELERIVDELGLLGALVNPGDGRRFLDDPAAEPLLAAAEQLDVPLFVHPSRDVPGNEQYEDFQLGLIVGRPAQTATCAARLIFSGTLERHPDLRLLLAHGGGSLLFAAGRLDATWAAYRAAGRWRGPDVLDQAPSNYLRRFHVDTNTWSTAALRLLLDRLGIDRLVFGSDQPPVWFPLQQSVATVDFLDLSPEDAATIRWGNAARLFRLGQTEHLCSVCGFGLDFEPWKGESASDEICPCCLIQFGYDDHSPGGGNRRRMVHDDWRARWMVEGMPWRGGSQPPPEWNPREQLRRLSDQA